MAKVGSNVKLEAELWNQLQRIADELHVTRNNLIEVILKSYVHRHNLRKDEEQRLADQGDE